MTIDLDKCKVCEESRCIMSEYYGLDLKAIEEAKEEAIYQRIAKKKYNEKAKKGYLEQEKFWKSQYDREDKTTNYDRMNEDDYRHQKTLDLIMLKRMEIQERYYNSIKY